MGVLPLLQSSSRLGNYLLVSAMNTDQCRGILSTSTSKTLKCRYKNICSTSTITYLLDCTTLVRVAQPLSNFDLIFSFPGHVSLVVWILWHINLCRLFNGKSIIQMNISISNNSSSSSSSCPATSTDIPDHLSPLLPIIHLLRQVFWVTSRVLT